VLVQSWGTRHVSVDKNNDVWVSGISGRQFDLIDGTTGKIKRSEGSVGFGGYGGLIDKNGVIWSSNQLLRWDTANPLSGSNGVNWKGYYHDSYGLGIDSNGNVWNSSLYGNQIRKFASDGTLLGTYGHGYDNAQGVVADGNGDVWVAHSLWGNTVGHIKNDGTFVGNVTVGSGPTGVAVDSKGKIWTTNFNSGTVSRIDPTKGPVGADGVTPVGQVDLTTQYLGGNLYNYSDMTGSTLIGAPNMGSWSTVYDSGEVNHDWGSVDWNSLETGDGLITVSIQSSEDGTTYGAEETVINHNETSVADGRFLKITVNFKRSSSGISPILYDLTIKSGFIPQPPVVKITDAPSIPVAVNTEVKVGGTFTDPDNPDSHVAEWSWGDQSTSAGGVSETNGTVSGSHIYDSPGVYTLKLKVTDQYALPGEDLYQYIVVYDPSAGFVTGGGWIDSPAGAFANDPGLAGKASFGFVAKYQKGATVPTGQTQFNFQIGNLNFHSTSYDWLVVSGARAQYKGSGTINGTGDFQFMLTGVDGDILGGGSPDKFRIKISDKASGNIIYDNLLGNSDDAEPSGITSGNIVIHK
ncbi:MAG TPA: PKD domain-containing protein, partial [Verrucomicrobiae bacterium]|nr:PKD domain-containing protein [Verrucomicrobiae bacterium]